MTKLSASTWLRGRDMRPHFTPPFSLRGCLPDESASSVMTIGRHGCATRRTCTRPWSMTPGRVPRCRPNALALPRYSSLTTTSRWRRAMTRDANSQLWDRSMGIRFSSKFKAVVSYPRLDVARFLHGFSNGAEVESAGFEPQTDEEHGARRNDDSQTSREDTLKGDQSSPTPAEVPPKAGIEDAVGGGISQRNVAISPRVTPPVTSISYQIDPELFQRARGEPQGSPDSFWSHTMYRCIGDDGTRTNVKVHYCTSKHTMEYVCKKYFVGEKVLGFDLEWDPWATKQVDARHNVSLIQMASPGHIGLFHCAVFFKDDFVAPTFKEIMEDAEVSKAGVNIRGDCTRLRKYLGVDTRGIFELSNMYKMVKYIREDRPHLINKVPVTLATQVHEVLGLPLRKDTVRMSNWTRYLNNQQILYSASDAYAGIQLYHVLDEERQKLDPCPPRPQHAKLNLPIPMPTVDKHKVEPTAESAQERKPDKSRPVQVTTTKLVNKKTTTSFKFGDNRVIAADTKMLQYRSSKGSSVTAGPSALRAYYIWHANEDLKPDDIAKLLRQPPLQTNTVVSYILEAVTGEKMPYCRVRMRDELLASLSPTARVHPRYQTLVKACQDATLASQA